MVDEVVPLLQRLIACDTSNPPGDEAKAAQVIEEYLGAAGIECERVAKDSARPNLVARLRGSGDGPSLAFLGHLDVVQARAEDWSVHPFAGVVRDGAVWGRGAVDMKCQVAASCVALARLARAGHRPQGDLMLLLVADEEVGDAGVGVTFLVEARPDLKPDFVVGEGAGERYQTDSGPVYLLDRGVKGTAEATVTVRGIAADASLPGNGASAVLEAGRLLERLRTYTPSRRVPPEVEPLLAIRDGNPALAMLADALTTNVLAPVSLESVGPANVVREQATLELNCVTLPGTTKEELEHDVRTALGEGSYTLEVSAPQGGSTSELGTPLYDAIVGFLGASDPEARVVPTLGYGFSDCHTIREAYGSVAYGFIPFRHAQPSQNFAQKHGVDERVLIDDLVFQAEAAEAIARAF
jgi:acetylornithine deacetylase/succinyl-diaminopimelate desuccinylase-like protein